MLGLVLIFYEMLNMNLNITRFQKIVTLLIKNKKKHSFNLDFREWSVK